MYTCPFMHVHMVCACVSVHMNLWCVCVCVHIHLCGPCSVWCTACEGSVCAVLCLASAVGPQSTGPGPHLLGSGFSVQDLTPSGLARRAPASADAGRLRRKPQLRVGGQLSASTAEG